MTQVAAPLGNTPQGQQLAAGQPNSTNVQAPPPGSPISAYPSDPALNSAYSAANTNLVTANSANTRKSLVNSYGLPQMQSNYDDLAQQLFNYDTGVLNPKFQGNNAGTPADAASFGRVDASPLAMTQGSLNNPVDKALSAFNTNPKYAYTTQTDQANSILNILSSLTSRMSSTLGMAGTKDNADVNAALSTLTGVKDIMGQKADLVKTAANNATELKKTLLSLGLATVDDNGNIVSNNSTPDISKNSSRKDIQDYYNSLPPGSPIKTRIASQWKTANGNSLFPGTLSSKDQDSLTNTVDLMNRVQRIVNVYNKYKDKIPQGKIGEYQKFLITNHVPGTPVIGPMLAGDIPPDLQQAITDMIALRGQGERQIIGGRLTGYLLQVLGPAFPGIDNMADLTKAQLSTLQQGINNKLKVFAKSAGYNDVNELMQTYSQDLEPTSSGASGGGANRKAIVSKLKAAGKSDDVIHEYLRAKGIDN